MARNPFGSPPRVPPHGHGIPWHGEQWYAGDACAAVGIHVNTYLLRRRKKEPIALALRPPERKGWKRKRAAPPIRQRVPTRRELHAQLTALTERVAKLEAP